MRSRRPTVDRVIAAAVAACVIGSTSPANADVCSTVVTSITRINYSKYDLTALLLSGRFSEASVVTYSVTDDDGFLSLALVVLAWVGSGQMNNNRSHPIRLTQSEISLLIAIAEIGERYQRAVQATLVETSAEQRAANHAVLLQGSVARETFWIELGRKIRTQRNAASRPDDVRLPVGFVASEIGPFLNQFVPTASARRLAQYSDGLRPGSLNVLCDPRSASVLVGPVACRYDFVTGAIRDPAFCPDGLGIAELWRTRTCDGTVTDRGVAQSNCTAEFVQAN